MKLYKGTIAARADELAYDDAGPGLYADETTVMIDGSLVAVSVEPHWIPNGAGLALHGYARAIRRNGETLQSPDGHEIETSISVTLDPITANTFPVETFAREVLAALTGGEPALRADPAEGPILPLSAEVRANANIRLAIQAVGVAVSGINLAPMI